MDVSVRIAYQQTSHVELVSLDWVPCCWSKLKMVFLFLYLSSSFFILNSKKKIEIVRSLWMYVVRNRWQFYWNWWFNIFCFDILIKMFYRIEFTNLLLILLPATVSGEFVIWIRLQIVHIQIMRVKESKKSKNGLHVKRCVKCTFCIVYWYLSISLSIFRRKRERCQFCKAIIYV